MIQAMSIIELGSYICSELSKQGIEVVLSGGSCVQIYSDGAYTSYDLDMINRYNEPWKKIQSVMLSLGFREEGKYFTHPDTHYFIEFPSGPLGVGDAPVTHIHELTTPYGTLRLLSPTDCIKDRLAAYYHWNDTQSLIQAIQVASKHPIDMEELREWSANERALEKFEHFKSKAASAMLSPLS